ncbi:MAG: FAD-binding protein, partial [Gallionella sp.]
MKSIALLLKFDGRVTRRDWLIRLILMALVFSALGSLVSNIFGAQAANIFAILFVLGAIPVTMQRLHDVSLGGGNLLWVLVPVLGPLWVLVQVLRSGVAGRNRFGEAPADMQDYAEVNISDGRESVINDVSQLNPITVNSIATPRATDEVVGVVRNTSLPISIGGGHFSMGGTTSSPDSIHLDLRGMNKVLEFHPESKRIFVQAGIRWCDIQHFIDPHNLSVKIMQTYANFTVGGTLSVNAHGRYMGLGPVVLSVRSMKIVLSSGEVVNASPLENSEIFYASIGGYGALGVITEVELGLTENIRVEQKRVKMPLSKYAGWFDRNLRGQKDALFHNADMYPPHFKAVSAVTWRETDAPATSPRLLRLRKQYPLETYFLWAISETPLGKFRREHIIDPLIFMRKRVHYRNYEAGYDAAELEPIDRKNKTWVLQEYFIPVARFDEFSVMMGDILRKHNVNVLNISIRHAVADPGTWMAWARGETFAFVLYYKQGTDEVAKNTVAVWTRELIDAVLASGGTYYLPYQQHATQEQFHRAYPQAERLFGLKSKLDPNYRFRNTLWDKYYLPWCHGSVAQIANTSLFHRVYGDTRQADSFYQFLQNIFNVVPHEKLHTLICQGISSHASDEAIYRHIQSGLNEITPSHAPLTYAIPSLRIQKQEIAAETKTLLSLDAPLDGYVEIGSPGRYVKALQELNIIKGKVALIHDRQPGYAPPDLVERGQLTPV